MYFLKKTNFLMLLLCIYVALTNPDAENSTWVKKIPPSLDFNPTVSERYSPHRRRLQYNFYRESCPQAERIIQEIVWNKYESQPDISPALLRLLFHDCFIQGCDASVLLDPTEGMASEKDSPPNETLRGFDVIDTVKSEIEKVCPGIVSCADILVLAAREALLMAGGPFYPLRTGRRDSMTSYPELAKHQLPSPDANLSETLASFASRGFTPRELVSLLGAHSVGSYHCKFFQDRLHNFSGTNQPDPSLDKEFLQQMRSRCDENLLISSPVSSPSFRATQSPVSSVDELRLEVENGGSQSDSVFGASYYWSLLERKGILYADQQLMAGEMTRNWVRTYAWRIPLFRRDFAEAMMKLSNLRILTAPYGQVRLNCSKVARGNF